MPTSITQNNNQVEITESKPIITVTDNNKGTSVDVTQVDITTVSVATPGPKGDRGLPGVLETGAALNSGELSVSGSATITGSLIISGSTSADGDIIPAAAATYNLGSAAKPFKDLFLHTASLKFVRDGNVIATIEGEDQGIKIGNIQITTASIDIINNAGSVISTIAQASSSGGDIVSAGLADGTISSSIQIATDISGSFTSLSSSIATRFEGLTTNYNELDNIPSGIISSSAQLGSISSSTQIASDISGSVTSLSASIATRFEGLTTDYTALDNIPSGIISSSAQIDANLFNIDGIISSSAQVTSSLGITGSLNISSSLTSSTSIIATNIQNGYPTSNQWQTNLDGSYFNNFDNTTHVSEILRFVAGLLSSSAANPTANSRTYGSLSENKSFGSTDSIAGNVPQDQDIDDITYLIDKGFAEVGGTLFSGRTVYKSTTPLISYTSVAGGSSTVSSSADSQLFGLGALDSGGASAFKVSGSHGFVFANTGSDEQSEASSSAIILTQSSFGTSAGLTLAKLASSNPAVIPAAFQDGKFASVFSKNLVNWTAQSLTSVSSSGTYTINTTIGIATGSQVDFATKTASETIFWSPIDTIETNIGSQTLATGSTSVTALTLTSGSLSGAPYATGGTYKLISSASGLFEPLYASSTTLGDVTITSPSPSNVSVTNTAGIDTLSTSGGTIQTANAVYSTSGVVRSTSSVPFRTDNFHIDATYTLSGTGTTFSESGFADTDFILAIKGRNRASSQSTLKNNTIDIHTAGAFGQPAASGSMGYFGGGTTSTTLIEYFTTESYRRVISAPTTLTTAWDSTDRIPAGDGEGLQVKPGYLVNPESANGYWYITSGYSASHYKWYLREFTTGASSNQSTLTINLNPNSSNNFIDLNNTSNNKIAFGVIFESQLPANSGDTRTIIFDPVKGNSSYGGTLDNQGASNQLNPFNANVDVQADFSSLSNSGGTLTLGLNNAAGQTINGTHDKIWLLVRYTGTPSNTLERITISVS